MTKYQRDELGKASFLPLKKLGKARLCTMNARWIKVPKGHAAFQKSPELSHLRYLFSWAEGMKKNLSKFTISCRPKQFYLQFIDNVQIPIKIQPRLLIMEPAAGIASIKYIQRFR